MEGKIYSTISILAGKDAATQLQLMIQRIVSAEGSSFTRTVGVISMVLGLAAIFTEIQDSINRIWALKTTPKLDWKRYLIKRAISFGIFSIIGFVLVLSVLVNHFPAYFPLSRLKVPEQ